ncbi:MAG: YHYH protein [Deltaproteobacteria bacterium]|nr:YHYH protein [Deltaproteobacteria bacterium]
MRTLARASIVCIGALVLAGCGDDGDDDGGSGDGGQVEDDGGTRVGERTLASCETQIAADVPDFFKTYFRCVTISKTASAVVITTRSLPPHRSAYYASSSPNYTAFDPRDGSYHKNPNQLVEASFSISVPLVPVSRNLTITSAFVDRQANTNPYEYPGGPVGVALDSVAIFNDQAALGDDIDNERFTFDSYEAHPAPNGQYHYHSATPGPLEVLVAAGLIPAATPGSAALEVYGIMCDGTVVLGCTELDGSAVAAAGLDAQNGHSGDLKDRAGTVHFTARYHTHVCPGVLTVHKYMPEIASYSACTVTR